MAAALNPGLNLPRVDGRCKYTAFRSRPEGKVPCLGLGPTTPDELDDAKGEVTGMCFQKVDTGRLKPGLRVDSFLPVRWEAAPTQPPAPAGAAGQQVIRDLHNRLDLVQIRANRVAPEWQEFTDAMGHVKRAMLNRMTFAGAGGQQPVYLLDGLLKERWRGAPGDDLSLHDTLPMLQQISSDIGAGANWNPIMKEWIGSLCGGLCNPKLAFRKVFLYLLPSCENENINQSFIPVVSAAHNCGLQDGAVRCLMYGFQPVQPRPQRGRPTNRDLEHRFLLSKRSGDTSRSRSRSPVNSHIYDDEKLHENVHDPQNPNLRNIRINDLIDNNDSYLVNWEKFHVYFESHTPDLLIIKNSVVPDPDYPGCIRQECVVKLVIVIASYIKVKAILTDHIKPNVEQCVESCLAAFGCNQDLMYGLVVVVDGFVLIKVQKQNQGGQEEYNISETDLIMWDDPASLHALFNTVNNHVL